MSRTNSDPDRGSCHCGAVTLAVKVDKPLEARDITVDEERIVECNCSICARVNPPFLSLPGMSPADMCVADAHAGRIRLDLSTHRGDGHRG